MTFKVRYGIEEHEVVKSHTPTIGDVKHDSTLKMILGFGDNLRALVNGVEMPDDSQVPEGGTVVLEVRANQKASLLRRFFNWFVGIA